MYLKLCTLFLSLSVLILLDVFGRHRDIIMPRVNVFIFYDVRKIKVENTYFHVIFNYYINLQNVYPSLCK